MARLQRGASVCALIPHYECEGWLGAAIASLMNQSRPVDAIVVIDDRSAVPPTTTVERFPGVTLLRSSENVGPYRLAQAVIDATTFDAYLFQDADDWSARDRLAMLLDVAVTSGAEMVGSQEIRLFVGSSRTRPFHYPLDVNEALRQNPTAHTLQHPTSLIGRDLVRRIGGFATGLRFAADTEFVRRASYAARIRNTDQFAYFRRQWPGSLTMAPDTGIRSRQRTALHDELSVRAKTNAQALRDGRAPDLRPWSVGSAPTLELLAGPPLSGLTTRPRRQRTTRPRPRRSPAGPVFVVGAARSGNVELAWTLAQADGFVAVPDRSWILQAMGTIDQSFEQQATPPQSEQELAVSRTLANLLLPQDGRAVLPLSASAAALPWLVERFPKARFLHVVRDPDEVATSLAIAPMEDGVFYNRETAYKTWTRDLQIGLALEASLGTSVMRVYHRELWSNLRPTLDGAFAFLGCPSQTPTALVTAASLFPMPRFRTERPGAPHAASAREEWRMHQSTRRLRGQRRDIEQLRRALRAVARREANDVPIVHRVRQLVSDSTAQGSVIAVVSRGDEALVNLDNRTGWHFPSADEGYYAGFYPASSEDAIRHLEELRSLGATHFAIPATAFWWLEYYSGLREYLALHARLVAFMETCGAVWDIVTPHGEPALRASPEIPQPALLGRA